MRTRVSPNGKIVIPASIRRKLGIRAGDLIDIVIEQDRVVLTRANKPKYKARIVEDPITGFTVIDLGPDAPILTSEMVRELLSDFP